MTDRLHAGESLSRGGTLRSADGMSRLELQEDGNLVLYSDRSTPPLARWATGTFGRAVRSLEMQADGNLVLLGYPDPIWASDTYGNPDAYCVMQDDENFVLYKDQVAIWNTRTALQRMPLHNGYGPDAKSSIDAGMSLFLPVGPEQMAVFTFDFFTRQELYIIMYPASALTVFGEAPVFERRSGVRGGAAYAVLANDSADLREYLITAWLRSSRGDSYFQIGSHRAGIHDLPEKTSSLRMAIGSSTFGSRYDEALAATMVAIARNVR